VSGMYIVLLGLSLVLIGQRGDVWSSILFIVVDILPLCGFGFNLHTLRPRLCLVFVFVTVKVE
jgi:hypothetical protein